VRRSGHAVRRARLDKAWGDGVREFQEPTAHYVGELLRSRGLRASHIAPGLPMGGELEQVDRATLAQPGLGKRTTRG
jgi:hypothetical protein